MNKKKSKQIEIKTQKHLNRNKENRCLQIKYEINTRKRKGNNGKKSKI